MSRLSRYPFLCIWASPEMVFVTLSTMILIMPPIMASVRMSAARLNPISMTVSSVLRVLRKIFLIASL